MARCSSFALTSAPWASSGLAIGIRRGFFVFVSRLAPVKLNRHDSTRPNDAICTALPVLLRQWTPPCCVLGLSAILRGRRRRPRSSFRTPLQPKHLRETIPGLTTTSTTLSQAQIETLIASSQDVLWAVEGKQHSFPGHRTLSRRQPGHHRCV